DRAPEPPPTTFRTTRMPPAPMNITLIECHAFRPVATAKIAPRTARATIAPASVSTNRLTAALPAHFFIASLSHPRDAGPTRDLHHILACAYVSVCLHYGHGGRAEGTRRTPPEADLDARTGRRAHGGRDRLALRDLAAGGLAAPGRPEGGRARGRATER